MKKYKKLRKNSIGYKIVMILNLGGKFTAKQMAAKLGISYGNLYNALQNLAKTQGIVIRPVGTIYNPFKKNIAGILTIATETDEDFQEVNKRNKKSINGRTAMQFNFYENRYLTDPNSREGIMDDVDEMQLNLLLHKKEFKKMVKERN